MKQSFLYIANWKMNSSFEQSLSFCTRNKAALLQLGERSDVRLVIAPSFPILFPMTQIFANTKVNISAQNCSEYLYGAYTGQVDAPSLAQVGCTYCIIGHSESRMYFGETNEQVAHKVKRLLEQYITPIICIGETESDYQNGKTYLFLEQQLLPLRTALSKASIPCIIAYEPIWSIGTGITPPAQYLTEVFSWLSERCAEYVPNTKVQLLYGGSVDENNATPLKSIAGIDGFLIGSASLDFEKLQKIIVCTY